MTILNVINRVLLTLFGGQIHSFASVIQLTGTQGPIGRYGRHFRVGSADMPQGFRFDGPGGGLIIGLLAIRRVDSSV